jgi:hypothetical protein
MTKLLDGSAVRVESSSGKNDRHTPCHYFYADLFLSEII